MKWKVIVSTDSETIRNISTDLGARVMRYRPNELATDDADAHEVWQSEVKYAEKIGKCRYDLSVFLEPTCPLRTSEDIDMCIDVLKSAQNYDAAATVSEIHGNQHPMKLHKIDNTELGYYDSDGIKHHNRQTIGKVLYWRNGACYASRVDSLMKKKKIFETGCAPILIERPIVNIDSKQDARIAAAIERAYNDNIWKELIKLKTI